MQQVKVQCPNPQCGHSATIPAEFQGKTVRCKSCGQKFIIPDSAEQAPTRETDRNVRPTGDSDPTGQLTNTAAISSSPQLLTQAEGGGRAGPGPITASDPRQIGRFQIRSKLGAGAFGTVYRAYDPQLDREVALKVPQVAAMQSPKAMERFLREAKATARLQHPHIVPVFDAGRDGQHFYIASAFIKGRTLAHAVDDKKIDCRQAAKIVRDLAEALGYAHGLGIVHRDVKSSNVMLDEKGEAHLMDFGLASRQDGVEKLTQEGAILGTPSYMAPEQASGGGSDAMPACDQYSLGVILYELLTGQTPFSGPPQVVLFHAIHTQPASPFTLNPVVPPELETICLKALSKRPEDRYASCQGMADDLARWLAGEAITARPPNAFEKTLRWCAQNRLVAAGIGFVLVAGLSLGIWLAMQPPADKGGGAGMGGDRPPDRPGGALLSYFKLSPVQPQLLHIGGKLLVEVRVERQDYQDDIDIELENLPAKVTAKTATIAKGESRVEIELDSTPDAAETRVDVRVRAHIRANNLSTEGKFKLAVQLPPDLQISPVPPITLMPSRKQEVEINVLRRNANEEITVKAEDLPEKVTVAPVKIPAGQTKGTLVFDAAGDAPTIAKEVKLVAKGGNLQAEMKLAVTIKELDAVGLLHTFDEHQSNRVYTVAYSPDRRRGLSGDTAGNVFLWDLALNRKVGELKGHKGPVWSVAFSPDGQTALTSDGDGQVRLWDVGTQTIQKTLGGPGAGHKDIVTCVAYSPDGARAATGSLDQTVRIWDLKEGKEQHVLMGHEKSVFGVAFVPNSTRLLSVSGDIVRTWDADKGTELGKVKLLLKDTQMYGLAVSPDGRNVLVGGQGGRLLLFDILLGQGVDLLGHTDDVYSVAFSPDSKRAISGSRDRTLRLWDIATRKELNRWTDHAADVQGVAYSASGRRALSGSHDGKVRHWGLPDPNTSASGGGPGPMGPGENTGEVKSPGPKPNPAVPPGGGSPTPSGPGGNPMPVPGGGLPPPGGPGGKKPAPPGGPGPIPGGGPGAPGPGGPGPNPALPPGGGIPPGIPSGPVPNPGGGLTPPGGNPMQPPGGAKPPAPNQPALKPPAKTDDLMAHYRTRMRVTVSSQWSDTWSSAKLIDGNLETSWFSDKNDSVGQGKQPWFNVIFPEDVTIRRAMVYGVREPNYVGIVRDLCVLDGRLELFDAKGSSLGVVRGQPKPRTYDIPFDFQREVTGVRSMRFTSISDRGKFNEYGDIAIGEVKAWGE